ncbi:hypothetical protein Zmor_015236 [Zophobas morio]|uniref:Retrovirus-related Pol polyprotein from type-1 retrotransposable element R2 n=1 Tax=Zophobas morio TaxID=2755281 RepID=A0AA38MHE4_9CUCU|nr:hypothetical protein Zmor_015236 [Zophobas morio]
MLKTHVLLRIFHSLMGTKITKETLASLDIVNRQYTKNILHLHLHTSNEAMHAPLRDGGLGVWELATYIPQIYVNRLYRLQVRAADDPVVSAMLSSQRVADFKTRLLKMTSHFPEGGYRELVERSAFTRGLTCTNQDSSSRSWISSRPYKWSASEWVRAIHLRTSNLPTVGIPSNPTKLRKYRGGCSATETVCHILQSCPVAHDERVYRYHAVVKKIAEHCVQEGWRVEEEPHVKHEDRTLFKPDLVITFHPLILGAKGIWPSCNASTETAKHQALTKM